MLRVKKDREAIQRVFSVLRPTLKMAPYPEKVQQAEQDEYSTQPQALAVSWMFTRSVQKTAATVTTITPYNSVVSFNWLLATKIIFYFFLVAILIHHMLVELDTT